MNEREVTAMERFKTALQHKQEVRQRIVDEFAGRGRKVRCGVPMMFPLLRIQRAPRLGTWASSPAMSRSGKDTMRDER